RQIRQWKARSRAFDDQRSNVILDPLALVHLRHRRIRRWAWALAAALLAFGATAAMYWPILRHAFSGASMLSTRLLPTSATFRQLAEAATTPWVYGVGTGVPAPPSPWLLVLMAASVLTGGHVAAALALVFFLSAPAGVLSFWALAGVVTRSNPIRVASALCWYGLSLAFGLYDTANLPMLTVMTFLPAALALSFKAVGMYRTEDPVNPRSSVQAAAAAALLFIPAVAAEPQLLLALVVIFVAFLVFVRRHRLMLLLIPLPAAFALAPTLVNAVRYAGDGMWRQLFGDVMVPTRPVNGEPEAIGLTTMVWRAFGLEAAPSWPAMLSCADPLRTLIVLCCAVCAVIALLTLLRSGMLRPCRILWTVTLCGLMLAVTSAVVVIAVTPDGAAAGSVLPGVALAACGMLACVAMAAGPGVTPCHRLVTDHTRRFGATTLVQGAVTLFLTAMTAVCLLFGVQTANAGGVAIAGSGLPMVAQDYLAQDPDRRVLALAATNADTVAYTAMRTGRGDLIDSSAAWRVSCAFGHEEHTDDEQLAHIAARLLANSDNDAIRQLSDLGFGGIYVVTDEGRDLSARAGEQLQANVTASQGTQEVVSNAQGTYYRLTLDATAGQHIDTDAQLRMETSPWRTAWLWCLAILVAIYGIIAIPRSHGISKEDQQ
ncbi:MAG: glycosyl transferase family 2, partial [Bifidobacterium choerinum]